MNINNLNYFDIDSLTSQADLKKLYRQQSKVLHPDAGGTAEQFQQLNKEFEYIKEHQLYDANIRKDFKLNKENARNIKQPKSSHSEDFYKNTEFTKKTSSETAKNIKPSSNLPAVVNENTELATKTLNETAKSSKGILSTLKGLPKGVKIAGAIAGTAIVANALKDDKDKNKPSKKEIKRQEKKDKIIRDNRKNIENWRLMNDDLNNAKNISQFSKGHSSYKLH